MNTALVPNRRRPARRLALCGACLLAACVLPATALAPRAPAANVHELQGTVVAIDGNTFTLATMERGVAAHRVFSLPPRAAGAAPLRTGAAVVVRYDVKSGPDGKAATPALEVVPLAKPETGAAAPRTPVPPTPSPGAPK